MVVSVRLTQKQTDIARALGGGNVSRGIALAIEHAGGTGHIIVSEEIEDKARRIGGGDPNRGVEIAVRERVEETDESVPAARYAILLRQEWKEKNRANLGAMRSKEQFEASRVAGRPMDDDRINLAWVEGKLLRLLGKKAIPEALARDVLTRLKGA